MAIPSFVFKNTFCKYYLKLILLTPNPLLTSSNDPSSLPRGLGVLMPSRGVLGRGMVLDIVREGAGSPGIKTFPTFEQQRCGGKDWL